MDRSCSCSIQSSFRGRQWTASAPVSNSVPIAVPRAPANHLKASVSISAAPCPSKSRQNSCRRSVAAALCYSFIRKFLWSLLLSAPASSQVPVVAAALASASSQVLAGCRSRSSFISSSSIRKSPKERRLCSLQKGLHTLFITEGIT